MAKHVQPGEDRRNTTIDWTVKEAVRAKLRTMVTAGTAVGTAWNIGIDRIGWIGVIPTEKEVAGIVHEGWAGDPYNRDEHL